MKSCLECQIEVTGKRKRCPDCAKKVQREQITLSNRFKYANDTERREKVKNYNNEYLKRKTEEDPEFLNIRREKLRINAKERYKNNPHYKMYVKILRTLGFKNNNYFVKNYGYTVLEFNNHLESLFTDEMNWSNYAIVWEIDHIVPVLKMIKGGYTEAEINKLSNIRPCLISENRKRKGKFNV